MSRGARDPRRWDRKGESSAPAWQKEGEVARGWGRARSLHIPREPDWRGVRAGARGGGGLVNHIPGSKPSGPEAPPATSIGGAWFGAEKYLDPVDMAMPHGSGRALIRPRRTRRVAEGTGPTRIIPVHFIGWTFLSSGRSEKVPNGRSDPRVFPRRRVSPSRGGRRDGSDPRGLLPLVPLGGCRALMAVSCRNETLHGAPGFGEFAWDREGGGKGSCSR